ncbi:acyl-CoA thioesterase [Chitinilyticum piscinae]|uniref:Thioesterase family protein n=1 Tax=Chitinilyticum piscinae TaxID=2866724 RepID=A0A8J7K8P5_9NEIS|nr:thioesterase family protein [Chitinilyticum piscinae]MBE9609838.1 thioesterase family protein [Chitinilyticum piscinae]
MPRLKLDLPEPLLFRTTLEIRVTDLNYGNHLANHALLGLLHEARLRWLKSCGFASELAVAGCGLIQNDAALIFLRECHIGEVLEIELRRGECTRTSFDLYYLVTTGQDRQHVAQAKTLMSCFDYQSRRIKAIPAELKQALENTQASAA